MTDSGTFTTLIHLADEIIASSLTPELIDKIEEYAEKFSSWYEAYQKSLESGAASNSKGELEALLEKHERVVGISDKLKEIEPQELSKLKQKGKGIMAYTDTLPKKISLTKTRKG